MRLTIAAALLAAVACSKAGDESAAKRSPSPPPPPNAQVPDTLNIPLEVHGRPSGAIDAATLRALEADFVDDEHRAWKLDTVLGARARGADTVVEAVGEDGVSIVLRPEGAAGDPVPALVLTRRGEVAAAMIDPDEPFPDYHGQGNRLRRPGDPLPRIAPVAALRVLNQRAGGDNRHMGQAADPRALASLELVVDGKRVAPALAELAKLPTVPVDADGESRPGWSLRDLAAAVSAGARVTAVIGADGERIDIDDAAWSDTARVPVLRTNRRGSQVKFAWSRAGVAERETEVRSVARIELTGDAVDR